MLRFQVPSVKCRRGGGGGGEEEGGGGRGSTASVLLGLTLFTKLISFYMW